MGADENNREYQADNDYGPKYSLFYFFFHFSYIASRSPISLRSDFDPWVDDFVFEVGTAFSTKYTGSGLISKPECDEWFRSWMSG